MEIIEKAKIYVEKLLTPLEGLDYHRYSHTGEVYERAKYLAEQEGVQEKDLELLELACLFHDTGYIVNYDDNEIFGAKIARNFLIGYGYPTSDIKKIRELIMATSHEYMSPKNISEMIIKDADMDNLGREDFMQKMQHIKTERELAEGVTIPEKEWIIRCLDMLNNYEYFTKTQQQERNKIKQHNINSLEQQLP